MEHTSLDRHTREPVFQCQPKCSLKVSNESLKRNVFRKTSINKAQQLSCKKKEKFRNDIHERWYTLPEYKTVLGDTQLKVKILKIHKQLLDIKRKFKGTFNHWIYMWYYIALSLHVRATIIHSVKCNKYTRMLLLSKQYTMPPFRAMFDSKWNGLR